MWILFNEFHDFIIFNEYQTKNNVLEGVISFLKKKMCNSQSSGRTYWLKFNKIIKFGGSCFLFNEFYSFSFQ